jgi:hypothetical protein
MFGLLLPEAWVLETETEISGAFDEGERSGGVKVATESVSGLLAGVCWRKAFSDIAESSGSRDEDEDDGPRVKGVATVVQFLSNEQAANDERFCERQYSIYLLCVTLSLLSPIKAK